MQRAHPALADLCLTRDGNQQLQSSKGTQNSTAALAEPAPEMDLSFRQEGLLQVSSVRHSVNGQVSCVFGHVGVRAVVQQQADDARLSRCGRLVEDRGLVMRLRQHICPCGTKIP